MGSKRRVTGILFQKENLFLKLKVHVVRQIFHLGQKMVGRDQREGHALFLFPPFRKFVQHLLAAAKACEPSLLNIF